MIVTLPQQMLDAWGRAYAPTNWILGTAAAAQFSLDLARDDRLRREAHHVYGGGVYERPVMRVFLGTPMIESLFVPTTRVELHWREMNGGEHRVSVVQE